MLGRLLTMGAAVLVAGSVCAGAAFAQDATPTDGYRCMHESDWAVDAIKRLPVSARYWLEQDVAYILSQEERCSFLMLNTAEEREHFVEQFWYRRSADPDSPGNQFKSEHYRRIVFSNTHFGGETSGWKTDRGKVYVLFGPPDAVRGGERQESNLTAMRPGVETWQYRYLEGVGENVHFDFEYVYGDYLLTPATQKLLPPALGGEPLEKYSSDMVPDQATMEIHVGPTPVPQVRFRDLQAVVTARMVRDQIKFTHEVEFAAATEATTLARIKMQIPRDRQEADGQLGAPAGYRVFVRVSKPSGWVVDTSEVTVGQATQDNLASGLTVDADVDVALTPGNYQVAIVVADAASGDVGVVCVPLNVPSYEVLGAGVLKISLDSQQGFYGKVCGR
jgi:GWxTD domain-containing protein